MLVMFVSRGGRGAAGYYARKRAELQERLDRDVRQGTIETGGGGGGRELL